MTTYTRTSANGNKYGIVKNGKNYAQDNGYIQEPNKGLGCFIGLVAVLLIVGVLVLVF